MDTFMCEREEYDTQLHCYSNNNNGKENYEKSIIHSPSVCASILLISVFVADTHTQILLFSCSLYFIIDWICPEWLELIKKIEMWALTQFFLLFSLVHSVLHMLKMMKWSGGFFLFADKAWNRKKCYETEF